MQVTGRTQWDLPQTPQSIPLDDAGTFIFAEADADRVMPSRSAVLAAGRFDLHHGIMYQGGYKATAAALDRPHTWPRHKVTDVLSHLLIHFSDMMHTPMGNKPGQSVQAVCPHPASLHSCSWQEAGSLFN